MLFRANRLLLGLCFAAGMACPVLAQQAPSPGPRCAAFMKNAAGDWVAKQNVTVQGPTGPVQIKPGQLVDDEMQGRLDDQCK
jgi:hypothetical protein